jgi:hypothetical protein
MVKNAHLRQLFRPECKRSRPQEAFFLKIIKRPDPLRGFHRPLMVCFRPQVICRRPQVICRRPLMICRRPLMICRRPLLVRR